jgi:hypothetical protein
MTFFEELSSLILRVQNLRARIDTCEDPEISYLEKEELKKLLTRLEKMEGGQSSQIARVRATVEVNLRKEHIHV